MFFHSLFDIGLTSYSLPKHYNLLRMQIHYIYKKVLVLYPAEDDLSKFFYAAGGS